MQFVTDLILNKIRSNSENNADSFRNAFQNRSGKGAFSRDVPELLNRKTVRGATESFWNGTPEPTLINSGEPFFTGQAIQTHEFTAWVKTIANKIY